MNPHKIVVIDDEELMRITLRDRLVKEGYEVTAVGDGTEGLRVVEEVRPDLILCDLKMPGLNGLDLLEKVKALAPDTVVIMMTGYGTVETAVTAMKSGAYDYIIKPFLLDDVVILVERAIEVSDLRQENQELREQLSGQDHLVGLLGKSAGMQKVFGLIRSIAGTSATILVYGETGTGKERVAEAIHALGPRASRPLIKVSCTALAETLMESELFGHEKGAFTHAISHKTGRFEMAHESTLFLDDIDDISPEIQVKLLRVLQERKFERVGGTETLDVDVRLVAASKRDLNQLVREGAFREDLYYRLQVIPIWIPPLRERKDDIPMLVSHFLDQFGGEQRKHIAPEALQMLTWYDWPGNIRELENTVERVVALSTGNEITPADITAYLKMEKDGPQPKSIQSVVKASEREHIVATLIQTQGRRDEAASILGISRKTLWQKMKDYKIEGD